MKFLSRKVTRAVFISVLFNTIDWLTGFKVATRATYIGY